MENDLKSLSFQFAVDILGSIVNDQENAGNTLTGELIIAGCRTSFAASSAKSALSRDRFIRHLEEGYFSSGKTFELLKLMKASGCKINNIDKLLEDGEKIHRMFGASIKTTQRKNVEAGT